MIGSNSLGKAIPDLGTEDGTSDYTFDEVGLSPSQSSKILEIAMKKNDKVNKSRKRLTFQKSISNISELDASLNSKLRKQLGLALKQGLGDNGAELGEDELAQQHQ